MTSVFSANGMFARYATEIQINDLLLGGAPRDPSQIAGWIRRAAGVTQEEEVRQMLVRHLRELGEDVDEGAGYDDLVAASENAASERNLNCFKTNGSGPYVEGRQVKAMLKEAVNILFAGERWGKRPGYQGKGPKNFVAERVFVAPDEIPLGDAEVRIEHRQGLVQTPQGPRAILQLNEAAHRPLLRFEVRVLDDCLEAEQWVKIWTLAEHLGLGAARSQGHGAFEVTRWERLETPAKKSRKRLASAQS